MLLEKENEHEHEQRYYITPEDFKRAEGNSISNDTLRQRVYSYGWPKEKAITKPVSKGTGWKEYKGIAEEHGICYRTFADRRKRGWDPHEAATKPVIGNKEAIKIARASKIDTVFTDKQVQRAKCNGISRELLWCRVRRWKWDVETAINTPTLTPSEAASRGYQASSFNYIGTNAFWNKKRA
ncbi:hypothetical protein COL36_27945 [Bacillus wiedmannii]|nr:hypothetical protein COL36_27945 [Bacillus wiedmannii]PHF07793.1 hypothetical protein COF84_29095 [Bacillus wiedmannii]